MDHKTNWTENDYLNAVDMNRIESNIEQLATKLNLSLVIKKNRDYTSYDTFEDFNRIESNIETIIKVIQKPYWEKPRTDWGRQAITYNDLNRIEENIKIAANIILDGNFVFNYAGQIKVGEDSPKHVRKGFS